MEEDEEEYDDDPNLFARLDNKPMAFFMMSTGPERQMVIPSAGLHMRPPSLYPEKLFLTARIKKEKICSKFLFTG